MHPMEKMILFRICGFLTSNNASWKNFCFTESIPCKCISYTVQLYLQICEVCCIYHITKHSPLQPELSFC
jgi:hypothetical protein